MKIMAFGFIDDDLRNDLVTLNHDQTAFQVHFFDGEQYRFNSTDYVPVEGAGKITSIIISNDDIRLKSLLIISKEDEEDELNTLNLYRQVEKGKFEEFKESNINGMKIRS